MRSAETVSAAGKAIMRLVLGLYMFQPFYESGC
jgi:hypothetical protein